MGSSPLVSIGGSAAAKLGEGYCKVILYPTTVMFIRYMGYFIGSAVAKLGYAYCKANHHPTTVKFMYNVGCSTKSI